MRFNTHDRTPRPKMSKLLKILFLINGGLLGGVFSFSAVYCSITVKSIVPAVVIILPLLLIAVFVLIMIIAMKNAYIEVRADSITVVDYFVGRREKTIPVQSISSAEILAGSSGRVSGFRFPFLSYLVFRDCEGKYLFKVICTPERAQYFERYLKGNDIRD